MNGSSEDHCTALPRGGRLVVLAAAMLMSRAAAAQAVIETPAPSPKARVEQRVGITDVSIDYSSPGVKGRKIWGEVVPYDKVWRAGANAPTKLTVSRDFKFGGAQVKAGSYSMFVTPGKKTWTVALNTDLNATQDSHDDKNDVARVAVTPAALPALRERLVYVFSDTQDDRTSVDLEWERVRIRVAITIDTQGAVAAGIEKALAAAWQPHATAASYYFNSGDLGKAIALVDRSIAIESNWRNEWLRARIEGKKGNKTEATASANRALALGKGDANFEQNVQPDILKALAGWK
ncbi:MAG TPA: DUF2911 domain-containing protein [Kofleriaceae bacterium]|jgi:hypothetical protein|nr:DUF2911 domain-containing protein [Kofleriaceae bacterium]